MANILRNTMNDFYIIHDDEGTQTVAFRKSQVNTLEQGLRGTTTGCNVGVGGTVVFVPNIDVKTFLDNITEQLSTNAP